MLKVNNNQFIKLKVCKVYKVKRKGFTLIELIVTITIIMVISAVAAVTFTGTNTKARDSRRMADLEKVRTALELYRQANGLYPGTTTPLISDYLQSWPKDPKNFSYYYAVGTSYTYTLDAQMEDLGSTTGSYGANCGGTCNYRVTNP